VVGRCFGAGKKFFFLLFVLSLLFAEGCGSRGGVGGILTSSDVLIIQYHLRQHYSNLQDFCRRLYRRNPRYEPDLENRKRKLRIIFVDRGRLGTPYDESLSNEILTAAFAPQPGYADRIALLALGLRKSIDEGYGRQGPNDTAALMTSLQIPLDRLQRLYSNLKQVSWRFKVYRDEHGELLFRTNGYCPDGHLNMGYEVLMTKVLTRVEDDIYLRGGNPPHVVFRMSTMFLSLVMM